MTTLNTIILFLSGLADVVLVSYATYSFFALFRMKRRLRDIDRRTTDTLILAMENHIRNSVNMLNDMQRCLRSLVEEEQYHAAEQLRAEIASQKQNVLRQIEQMKKAFGDNVNIEVHFAGENNDNENK